MKKRKLYSIEGNKFKHKIPRNPTDKKENNKEKNESITDKIIRKKNEQ